MMKIKPDDPWYPASEYERAIDGCSGVTIRLKLAAMMSLGQFPVDVKRLNNDERTWIVEDGFKLADMIIDRANREE